MKILRQNQYNQGVGKNKLLSSTSGVGSIITTKVGSYVLISDINNWKFIKQTNAEVGNIRKEAKENKVYERSKSSILNRGLNFIDDERFVNFIRTEKELQNLVCLIGIPHMALNESFNTPNWNNHPIRKALATLNIEGQAIDYMVSGTHFPKWFKSKGELKKLSEWFMLWTEECKKYPNSLKESYFAPPRDAKRFIKEISAQNEDGNPIKIREYSPLEQTNLVLICPNGHLSDIPWPNYLRWKTEKILRIRLDDDKGEDLLSNEKIAPCCKSPKLKWSENKNKSEGYGSIYIECQCCGLGSNSSNEKPKINLEGINSIEPYCIGEKPWQIDISKQNDITPREKCYKINDTQKNREKMRVTLVTANNVYYASNFSSLYIPMHLAENKSKELSDAINILNERYSKHFDRSGISKENYWNEKFNIEDFIVENGITLPHGKEDLFKSQLKAEFMNDAEVEENPDTHLEYRWQEYRCFSNNTSLPDVIENRGIKFADIILPEQIAKFFKKIQQVDEIKVTNVQLDFTRVKPKERVKVKGKIKESSNSQNIFSIDACDLFVLPATESLGEGIFFEFSEEYIDKWVSDNSANLESRFSKFLKSEPKGNTQGFELKMKIFTNRYKHFLIHTFSHMMMRELEFSCGYPTASLKERLYISNEKRNLMSGVLIYTADGSEGSMGGLVSQGEPDRIVEIIKTGLERLINCSSDPLCWESEGQGIFDLNLAACFSCSLVAETACEERNLGLDRRVLVDESFGYFKDLLF